MRKGIRFHGGIAGMAIALATLIMMLAVEPRLGMEPTYYWDALTLAGNIDRYVVPNRSWTWYEFDHRLIDRFGSHRVIAARQGIPLGWEFSRDDIASVLSDWQWYIVQNRPGFLTGLDQQVIDRFGPSPVIAAK